jgi:hypothetical protein
LKDLCEGVERRLGVGDKLEVLSVAKRGVVPQSQTYDKEIASEDVSRYRVIEPGEFGLAPMALYYGAIGRYRGTAPGIISPAYNVFRHTANADPDYLETLIRMPRMVARYDALSQGGNLEGKRKLTPYDAFETVQIAIPPLPEQRAIAEVLASVEAAIAKTEALIAAIGQTTTALLKQYFIERQNSLHWSRVAKMGCWLSGGTPATAIEDNWKGPVPWVCPKDIKDPTVSSTIDHISEDAAKALGMVGPGTLLLVVRGMILVRSVPSTISTVRCAFNQDVKAFVPKEGTIPAFLKLWLDINEHKLLGEIETATHGTKRFPLERLNAFPVPVVTRDEQIRLVTLAESSQERLRSERENLSALSAVRDTLAQELLSGRIRLPDSIIERHRGKTGQAA